MGAIGSQALHRRAFDVISCRSVKPLREILAYGAQLVLMTVGLLTFAAVWRDFIVDFHKIGHHSGKRNQLHYLSLNCPK